VGVKNVYIGKSITELNAEKKETEAELKRLGERFTKMEHGSNRDEVGAQIYSLYYAISQIDQAIKATIHAN
jgi:hypothetical protein